MEVGHYLRVFIREVGFVPGRIARQAGKLIALQFDLPRSLERDLLISKLFTVGLNTADIGSTAAASLAILASIVSVRSSHRQAETHVPHLPQVDKLAAESLVILPSKQVQRLANIRIERQSFAA